MVQNRRLKIKSNPGLQETFLMTIRCLDLILKSRGSSMAIKLGKVDHLGGDKWLVIYQEVI